MCVITLSSIVASAVLLMGLCQATPYAKNGRNLQIVSQSNGPHQLVQDSDGFRQLFRRSDTLVGADGRIEKEEGVVGFVKRGSSSPNPQQQQQKQGEVPLLKSMPPARKRPSKAQETAEKVGRKILPHFAGGGR